MSQIKYSILVVDDEPAQRQFLSAALARDYTVTTASGGIEAESIMQRRCFDLIVTDERMPEMSGIELIRRIKEHSPEMPVIVLTAYGSIQNAVEAVKLGADDYLTKPLKNPEELRLIVAKALNERTLKNEQLIHKAETETQFPEDIIAYSEAMRDVLTLAAKVAPQTSTVLLTGESGTGKEVVARFIHRRSPRADNPFVAINCAALPDTLLESELFGYEKGAFTDAKQTKRGLFELAHGGTLFLDEIGEMNINLQAKLLRALEEQRFERLGGTRSISVDVRVIAATNKDLLRAIGEKTFREDLYYRLNVFPIHIPPLRERREDIEPLAEFFILRIAGRMGRSSLPLCPAARQSILAYDWPGNVRELQNALERALIVSRTNSIRLEDLPIQFSRVNATLLPAETLADIEKAAIMDALSRNDGNRAETVRQLGISLRTLQYRLKEYGLAGKEMDQSGVFSNEV
ncbi:MAG: sigma-54 dependent transcriptional regulator [Acidobacteriota bacterium]